MNQKTKLGTYSLDMLNDMLSDLNKVQQLGFCNNVLMRYESSQLQTEVQDDFNDIRNILYTLGGVDLTAPHFLNGMVVNQKWFESQAIKIDTPVQSDYELS